MTAGWLRWPVLQLLAPVFRYGRVFEFHSPLVHEHDALWTDWRTDTMVGEGAGDSVAEFETCWGNGARRTRPNVVHVVLS